MSDKAPKEWSLPTISDTDVVVLANTNHILKTVKSKKKPISSNEISSITKNKLMAFPMNELRKAQSRKNEIKANAKNGSFFAKVKLEAERDEQREKVKIQKELIQKQALSGKLQYAMNTVRPSSRNPLFMNWRRYGIESAMDPFGNLSFVSRAQTEVSLPVVLLPDEVNSMEENEAEKETVDQIRAIRSSNARRQDIADEAKEYIQSRHIYRKRDFQTDWLHRKEFLETYKAGKPEEMKEDHVMEFMPLFDKVGDVSEAMHKMESKSHQDQLAFDLLRSKKLKTTIAEENFERRGASELDEARTRIARQNVFRNLREDFDKLQARGCEDLWAFIAERKRQRQEQCAKSLKHVDSIIARAIRDAATNNKTSIRRAEVNKPFLWN